jgi:hypothetical protein
MTTGIEVLPEDWAIRSRLATGTCWCRLVHILKQASETIR